MAAVWSVIASWLVAHKCIRVELESMGYLWGFLTVLGAGVVYVLVARVPAKLFRITVLGTIGALVLIFEVAKYSDALFGYWKLRAITPTTWTNMVAQLRKLDQEKRNLGSELVISHDNPVKGFDELGLQSDFMGGSAGAGVSYPIIEYGAKSRCWGIFIDSNPSLTRRWRGFKCIRISDNGWFFVGHQG